MVNVCVCVFASGAVDSSDGASSGLIRKFIHMSLTTRIHSSNQSSKQAWQVNIKDLKRRPFQMTGPTTEKAVNSWACLGEVSI